MHKVNVTKFIILILISIKLKLKFTKKQIIVIKEIVRS